MQTTSQTLTHCKQTLNLKIQWGEMQEEKVEKELMMNLDIPCGVSICHCYDDHNSDAPVIVRNNFSL